MLPCREVGSRCRCNPVGHHHWICKSIRVFGCMFFDILATKDNLHRPLGAHYRNLRPRPRVIRIPPQMLARHDVVRAPVRLTRYHRDLRHRCLRKREEQLGPMTYDPPVLLPRPRQESRHVDKGHYRYVKAIAESHEAGRLLGGANVEASGEHDGIVPHDPDGPTLHPSECRDDILGVFRLYFEHAAVIEHLAHDVLHVVGHVGIVGHQSIERRNASFRIVRDGTHREGRCIVAARQVIEQRPHGAQRGDVVGVRTVGDSALAAGVDGGAAQFFFRDGFVGDGLDDLGTGDEHVGRVVDHEDEVGHGGAVDGASGAGTHDD
mmetsp:Transcript_19846/g.41615  ORF Transcript_19846/g.41615 Transcript_19846/m.41615 type:complete len:321 (-) Transcript_19846:278-1240(-)